MGDSDKAMRMILADVDLGGGLGLGDRGLGGAGRDDALAQAEEGELDELGGEDA
jgi:hypothetical protein